ncbi:ribosome small subunit-dependent GTPase A [Lutispora thermophila]|uniref:Small ribosomal subunit biogenesis GTPase RsgA n=1 Tax=Lutispora thermophila DSM 19022 TaxID=1122184 RepID=A0A1M6G3R4_9FIRM|nr:ribosome small subunit-dependent GTPase A [Lutispora thermophila]SHJ04487.1 ribosome biogenesis GTPase [Lutispora thermophila DSM 19022]
MISGTIIKGIGGFYYVDTGEHVYECRARGRFRKDKIIPLVGDIVDIEINDSSKQGYILNIHERRNQLQRPLVANIDQVIIVFAIKRPDINIGLLEKFLVYSEYVGVNVVVCLNKIDLDENNEVQPIIDMLSSVPYDYICTSSLKNIGIDELKNKLKGKVSVFAGPSGAGKSSLLNSISPGLSLKTGDLSRKTERGTHTTRHAELIKLISGGMVVDTPGFTSFDLVDIKEEELQYLFPEFQKHVNCRYPSCMHYKEPECGVKKALEKGNINPMRYEHYIQMLCDLMKNRRY